MWGTRELKRPLEDSFRLRRKEAIPRNSATAAERPPGRALRAEGAALRAALPTSPLPEEEEGTAAPRGAVHGQCKVLEALHNVVKDTHAAAAAAVPPVAAPH
jgi:hypothetical protein